MKKSLRIVAPVSGVILAAALLGPVSPAVAESGVPCIGDDFCTDTFGVTGEVEFWTVPNGVSQIQLIVAAGQGGGGARGGPGGSVAGWVSVSPGERLALMVGDSGDSPLADTEGAYGGGGVGQEEAAGGGGGSFVFVSDADEEVWEPLLIAGGGGGSLYIGATILPGGPGGYSDDNPDAEAETVEHAQGGTTSEAGYAGGASASFDGTTFLPGHGEISASRGGGGYFGGSGSNPSGSVPHELAGGGGSGYASDRVDSPTGGENFGPGQIIVRYSNFTLSEASLSVQPNDPVAGSPVTLEGTVTQYDGDWGNGTLHFSASLDGDLVYTESIDVDVDSGTGPWTGFASTSFIPGIAGEYTFSLWYEEEDFGEHIDAFAADVVLQVGAAPPSSPTPPSDDPEELAETGAPAGVALGVVGAGLLSGGAILFLLRRRTRS